MKTLRETSEVTEIFEKACIQILEFFFFETCNWSAIIISTRVTTSAVLMSHIQEEEVLIRVDGVDEWNERLHTPPLSLTGR